MIKFVFALSNELWLRNERVCFIPIPPVGILELFLLQMKNIFSEENLILLSPALVTKL